MLHCCKINYLNFVKYYYLELLRFQSDYEINPNINE
jgi:hypothetical protein